MDQLTSSRVPYIGDLVSWLGIAWIIAFLTGVWGVMIGIGKFGLSEFLFLICGAMVIGKMAYETVRDKSARRVIALVVSLIVIALIEYGAIHWTNGLSVEASNQQRRLSQLDQIPRLNQQLAEIRQQEAIDRAKDAQQIADIGQANEQLKSSIEKKDAILASIARAQYSLNFVPQMVVQAAGTTNDQILLMNDGKTNINVGEIDVEGLHQDVGNAPFLIAPGASATFTLNTQTKANIAARAMGGSVDRLPVECEAFLESMDNKKYSLKFTWFFTIKEGSIVSAGVIVRPMSEIKQM